MLHDGQLLAWLARGRHTSGYNGVIYQNPWAPADALDGKVPLRSSWRALREDDDNTAEQDYQATTRYTPQDYLVSLARIGDSRQERDHS